LGHPEVVSNPVERLLRLESDIYHPEYLDEPYVQIPSIDHHESLNFEEGEVIYENAKVKEWLKFWHYGGFLGLGFFTMFAPYALLMKTHFPASWALDTHSRLPYHEMST